MNLRLAAYISRFGGTHARIPLPLFEVRRRPGSVSSDAAATFAALLNPLQELVADLRARSEISPPRLEELAGYAASIGRQCYRGGQRAAGKGLIALGEELDQRSAEMRAWGPIARIGKRVIGTDAVEFLAGLRSGLRFRRRP